MADERPNISRRERKRLEEFLQQSTALLARNAGLLSDDARGNLRNAQTRLRECLEAKDGGSVDAAAQQLEHLDREHLQRFRKHPLRESIEGIGVAILIALFLRTFILEAFTIPSGSMIPTLAVGDFLFVNKLSYGIRLPLVSRMVTEWDIPQRGDVIVFVYPCNEDQDYIKRVVGAPGDVIDVDANGFVTLNGSALHGDLKGTFLTLAEYSGTDTGSNGCLGPTREHVVRVDDNAFRALHCGPPDTQPRRQAVPDEWGAFDSKQSCGGPGLGLGVVPRFPWKVPEGHFFVMGDNRGNSADSRYWGFVPMSHIKGKAMFIWMSWDGSATWSEPWSKVRWQRMFRRVHSL